MEDTTIVPEPRHLPPVDSVSRALRPRPKGNRSTYPAGPSQRVVIQASAAPADPPLCAILEGEGFTLVSCPDGRRLLEEVMHRPPGVVIYALRADCREDFGVLRLMRRAVPDVPLVLLAAEESLDTRKLTQVFRPIYYSVCPVDGAELCDVVRAALSRKRRPA